ncbi:ankyrin repeat domain-containing protein [Muricauda sp. ANG21]|uniref:ankyrin repeat domain-containing protein n=1 Tax=Allomuricauda sp. ANG21 TaxID=3042468 RepID=UPI003455D54D
MSASLDVTNMLVQAVDNGNVEMVQEALGKGAAPNTVFNSDWGWNVLDRAIYHGNIPIIEMLLEAGADVNHLDAQNENCLFKVIDLNNLGLVRKIVKKGAHVNQVSKDQGLTPICISLINRNLSISQYLSKKGAKINPFEPDGSVPFSIVIDNAEGDEDLSPLIDFLIDSGLDINAQDYKGWTAIMKTIKKGMKKTFKHLIKKGADVNLQNNDGNNPIFEAALKDDPEFLKIILSAGGDVENSLPSGFSPLMAACKMGFQQSSELLVNAGANVNKKDGAGLTPLMYAATSNIEIVRMLIKNQADSKTTCNQGKTALDYAKEFDNQEAYDELKKSKG